jgi:hypothetical protein
MFVTGIFQALMQPTALRVWLCAVAALRMLSVGIGVFAPELFKRKVYRLRPDYVNPLQGRTFACWTLVSCMLCVLCAFRMQEPTLYLATLGSFWVALIKFTAELHLFRTCDFKGALSPFVVSSVSIAWMTAGWGTLTSYA